MPLKPSIAEQNNSAQHLSLLARLFSLLVRAYQLGISPYLPLSCRYQPSCSQYAMDAFKIHGGLKGAWLAIKRIGRCHPWGGHGFDPVPPKK